MQISVHGGACCGIRHIHGIFGTQEKLTQYVQRTIDEFTGPNPQGKLLEIVMTNWQIEQYPEFVKWLKETGWKRVTNFINSSSGRRVHVLHYVTGRPHRHNGQPDLWRNI